MFGSKSWRYRPSTTGAGQHSGGDCLARKVDETGSAPLDDIVAALAGHPKPAGAAMVMVAAGILRMESGIVDGNIRQSRATLSEPRTEGGNEPERPAPPPGSGNGGGDSFGGQLHQRSQGA
ncbi:hypothetical protein [Devosia sp.]|uniref:hypothetical protein n=1 Tax=Devosia sp. TaxID=1871048 RepID=UPI002FC9E7C5